MKNLLIIILQSILGVVLVLGFFYLLGLVANLIETHQWLIIPLGAYVIYQLFKIADED